MKKHLFSIVMILALVIVAGSAMAASIIGDSQQPYKGGTYSYTLSGITVTGDAVATVSYEVGAGATFYNSDGVTPQTSFSIAAATNTSLSFKVKYGSGATSGKIKVSIAITGGCTNFITLDIAPVDAPTLALAISTPSGTLCQALNGTTNNVAASSSGTNTIDFTVVPTTSATGYNYDYKLTYSPSTINGTVYSVSIESGGGTISYSSNVATVSNCTATSVVRVTFATTPGAAVSLSGTLSDANLDLSVAEGGNAIAGSVGGPATATLGALPTIGSFSGLN